MKKILFLACLFCLGASAQNLTTSGTISAASTANTCTATSCVYYQLPSGATWVTLQIAGTWSGSVGVYSIASQNATYQNLNSQTWMQQATLTSNGTWAVAAGNSTFILVQSSSFASGSANVTMTASSTGSPLVNPILAGNLTVSGINQSTASTSGQCWSTQGGVASCGYGPGTVIPISSGGTGASTSTAALTNLFAGVTCSTGQAYSPASGTCISTSGVPGGTNGQVQYNNNGVFGGYSSVPVAYGGTGASTSSGALANLGGFPLTGGTLTGPLSGTSATFTQQMTASGVYSTASGCTSGNPLLEYNGTCTSTSAVTLTVTPPSAIFYGDSITAGVNVTNFANSYVARISNAFHTVYSDYAVSGAQACDVGQFQVFQDDSPTLAVPQPFRSLLISTNDADVKGPGAYEATFNACYDAILAWETVPLSNKVIGSNGTTTGTCANDTTYAAATGENCTSSGATITLSLTTTGGPVYIWFRSIDSDGGTWTYAIDGGTPVSETTALPTPIATQNGGTQGPVLIRVSGVASGTHSIVFTKTSSGGNMPIIAVGTPYGGGVPTTQPYLLVGSTPTQLSTAGTPPGGTCASSVSAYRADIASDVDLIGADTKVLYEWFPQNYLQASTAANDMGVPVSCYAGGTNYVHPNDNGHSEMAAALQAAFRYVPAVQNLYSSQLFQSYPTNYTVLPTDSVIYSNGGTITLPDSLPAGMEVAIVNYQGFNAVTITATSGAGDVPNLPAGGQSGVLLHHLSASDGWFAIATWGLPPTINKRPVTEVNGGAYTVMASDWNVYLYGTSPSIAFPSSGLGVGQSVQVLNGSSGAATVSGVGGISSLASGCGAIFTQEYVGGWSVITLSCAAPGALPSLVATTASIGGAPLTAGSCATGTTSVSGATTSMVVATSGTEGLDPGGNYIVRSYVSAAGTVTTGICAVSAGTPPARTYNLRVIQ